MKRTEFVEAVTAVCSEKAGIEWEQSPLMNPFVDAVMRNKRPNAELGGSNKDAYFDRSGMSDEAVDHEAARLRDNLQRHIHHCGLGEGEQQQVGAQAPLSPQPTAVKPCIREGARHSVNRHRLRKRLHELPPGTPMKEMAQLPFDERPFHDMAPSLNQLLSQLQQKRLPDRPLSPEQLQQR